MYRAMGCAHAQLHHAGRRLADPRGQGTVEHVGLILLVALLMAGLVTAAKAVDDGGALAGAIIGKIKSAVDSVKL